MSRVARSARVASRQRVETLSGAKTIESAETGELYLVSAASTVTLPRPQEGAYFKFIVSADITSASALVIQSHAAGSGDMAGSVQCVTEGGSGHAGDNHADAQAAIADGHDKLTIGDGSNPIHAGSRVECVSDGTNWFVHGFIWANDNGAAAAFGDQ